MWSDKKTILMMLASLTGFALVALWAGYDRMVLAGWHMAPFGDVLRWREALSMFLFAPAICVFFWLLARSIGRGVPNLGIEILLVLSIYAIACGMGMHDPTNRLQEVYRSGTDMTPAVRGSLAYLDDGLGHWVFWAGFVLGTWLLGFQQARTPLDAPLPKTATALLVLADLAFLWVMLTNLWDEYPKTKVDLGIIALAAFPPTLAYALRWRVGFRRLPMLAVIVPVFWLSILGTLAKWTIQFKWGGL